MTQGKYRGYDDEEEKAREALTEQKSLEGRDEDRIFESDNRDDDYPDADEEYPR
jgi:hypothetical protein